MWATELVVPAIGRCEPAMDDGRVAPVRLDHPRATLLCRPRTAQVPLSDRGGRLASRRVTLAVGQRLVDLVDVGAAVDGAIEETRPSIGGESRDHGVAGFGRGAIDQIGGRQHLSAGRLE